MESNIKKQVEVQKQPDGKVIITWPRSRSTGCLGIFLILVGCFFTYGLLLDKGGLLSIIPLAIAVVGFQIARTKWKNSPLQGKIEVIPQEGISYEGTNISFKDLESVGISTTNANGYYRVNVIASGNKIFLTEKISDAEANSIKSAIIANSGMSFS